jgi:hypothetical protein
MTDPDEERIAKVFGLSSVPKVNKNNLLKYGHHLLSHLDKNTILTGREDFPWEEMYVFGQGNQKEYEQLKKSNPSYKDEFLLLDISKTKIEDNDLTTSIKRISDGKIFSLGLSWLTTKDIKCMDYQLLDDYATWQTNW